MANIKSQIKRNHQNEKRRLRNRIYRGAARTAVKDARTALESKTDTQTSVLFALSTLDKAAKKGAIHPRNAARRKGRLMKQLAALGAQPQAAAVEAGEICCKEACQGNKAGQRSQTQSREENCRKKVNGKKIKL